MLQAAVVQQIPPRLSVRASRIVALTSVILPLAVLTVHAALVVHRWLQAIVYPFGLDYGEGTVWQQALLTPSAGMYGSIDHPPYFVFNYPPLYHLLVRALTWLTGDWLVAGRALSVTAALGASVLVAGLTFGSVVDQAGRRAAWMGAISAGLVTLTCIPIVICAPLMRVDMLAVALSLLGVYLAIRSVESSRLSYWAIGSFVLAVYTKQTAIIAPFAALPVLLLREPRRTAKAVFLAMMFGSIPFIVLTWQTDGGFLRHVFLYNVNRYSAAVAARIILLQSGEHAAYLLLAIGGLVVSWCSIERRSLHDARTASLAILTGYLALSTLMLAGVGKSGATINYFIEWFCICSTFIGVLVARALSTWRQTPLPALAIGYALLLQVAVLPTSPASARPDPTRIPELNALLARVRAAEKPVLSDDMVLLIEAGKRVLLEPSTFTELASRHQWDQSPLIAMIAAHRFAFVVTTGQRGDKIYDSRFSPAVSAAIETAYPRRETLAGLQVRLPPAPWRRGD